MLVLAINSGSSSLKCAVIDPEGERTLVTALADRLGGEDARVQLTRGQESSSISIAGQSHDRALSLILGKIREDRTLWAKLGGVGHRVVHGGETFTRSVVIDEDVISAIQACIPLAPLHNPANLVGIFAARQELLHLPQVAVFDTAFHQTMPETSYRYAVPQEWYEHYRIRRYGFHGTSHRFVAQRAAQALNRPLERLHVITAHLGNGCSAAAINCGHCVDTTMGFTPLEGLVMGTRSGDIDPALPFHLVQRGLPLDEVEQLLNRKSGLLGLSGLSNDMRTLGENYDTHDRARLAVDVFCHRLAKAIGGLSTNLPQLDALIFTGGIGEHSALVRKLTSTRLMALGIELDEEKNHRHETRISGEDSRSALLVIPTNEELMIARDVLDLCHPN